MLAGLVLLFAWESIQPFYGYFRGSIKKRGKHALRNLALGALNSALVALVFVGLWFAASVWAEEYRFAVVQFHHSNLDLSKKADRMLRAIIVSPNMHRVHHSRWQPETDSNYSSLFSFWDRLARTFRHNPHPENIALGLDEFDRESNRTVRGMLGTPLAERRRD